MKVGILTFHHSNYNYGAVLQAFSIYKLIETMGYESHIINYAPEPTTFRKRVAAGVVAMLGTEFRKFRKKYIPGILQKTNTLSELKQLNESLDVFIVGSDQVWRFRRDAQSMFRYYLDFVDDQKAKIAYAASFGVDYWEAGDEVTREIKTLVGRFSAISVREETGVEICRNVFGVESVCVLDPTLLLEPKFFHELADKKTVRSSEKPALVYMFLDDSKEKEAFFKETAANHHLKFVRINGKKLVPKKGFFLFKSVNSWLSNIKHAEIVVTDSFHCTVFSIIFKKKFICLANKHRGVTRLENLLKMVHLSNRLIFDVNQLDEKLLQAGIDYQQVEKLLSEEKNKSIGFLKTNLETVKQSMS
ncbi:Polysaccharide pyruvyl transferase [Mariniphaga anaerophila]|uniref:Polysaccharide pyruvyl transferase n=1 Tax=Mariniphaga anaerophila TaxID=1484053 RepID=A0A1M5BR17_9BACT|nr:polysaccharide pyruvyl transferase family protein [Mariniphaga anaerophila]SHF45023.1 Polysaccharide pyruvyl transferase [Mariniphaga anaerophila]